MRGQRFELVVRLVGRAELDELDLVELVLTDEAADVGAVRTGFAAETRRVRRVAERELPAVENLLAVKVGQRHFRGRDQKQNPSRRRS